MKNLLLIFFLIGGITFGAQGQDYESAIGLRLGYPLSVTYKKFISEANAVEVFGGFRSFAGYSYVHANAAYLIHNEIQEVDKLNWYYGGGGGVALYSFDSGFNGTGSLSLTVSAFLGLEYTFSETPISVSLDWVPTYFIGGFDRGLGFGSGALAVRYILGGN